MRAVLLIGSLMVALTGCGANLGDCGQVCEKANSCAVDERGIDTDCAQYCPAAKRQSADAACTAEMDAHFACWKQNSAQTCNVSSDTPFEGCNDSGSAWFDCLTAHCAAVAAAAEAEGRDPDFTDDPNCWFDGADSFTGIYPF